MRIFIGFMEVAGYYNNLANGLRELGVEVTFADLSGHPFKYRTGGASNPLVRLAQHAVRKRTSTPRSNIPLKLWWIALQRILMVPLFVWAIARHDAFIFGYNSTFFRYYELPILKLLGKKIIYAFHGSDGRPTYLDGSEMALERNVTTEDCIERARNKKRTIKKIERYADALISYPTYAHFHEKPIVSFVAVGLPYDLQNASQDAMQAHEARTRAIRILHSPSHPAAKGTPAIREAIKHLQEKGHPIELVEVIGKPNAVVLQELARCDFVVDQLYSDVPMPGFPTEAAWFCNPAVVGGYAAYEFERTLPPDEIPPTLYCHPNRIEASIEKIIVDEEYRLDLGRRARQFVEANWTPRKVAQRYLDVIEGHIPQDWLKDPKEIRYLHGAGLPEWRAKELVRSVIEKGSIEALQLSDKPELERLFLDFAGSEHG